MWNDIESGGVAFPRNPARERERARQNVQRVPEAYDIVDTASAPIRGPPAAKNCTGSGCCIPKCFAQKGDRGLQGVSGYPGPKGKLNYKTRCA
jgi:integrin beta 8